MEYLYTFPYKEPQVTANWQKSSTVGTLIDALHASLCLKALDSLQSHWNPIKTKWQNHKKKLFPFFTDWLYMLRSGDSLENVYTSGLLLQHCPMGKGFKKQL